MTLPKEIRYQSVRWILSKKSTEKQEAKRHGVSIKAIRNWITRYRKEHSTGRGEPIRPTTAPRVAVSVPTPVRNDAAGNDGAYERALESAGHVDDSVTDAGVAAEGSGVPEPNPVVDDPPPIAPPEIKPEDLIAFSEMVVCKIPETYAAMRGVELPAGMMGFSEKEKQSLALTAPYACQYAPAFMSKMPAAMAGVFVGTLILSCVQRLGYVKRLVHEKESAKAEIKKAEQDAGPVGEPGTPRGFPSSRPPVESAKDHLGFPT